jgi:uncharacterized protein GlcG (DUF336 family)
MRNLSVLALAATLASAFGVRPASGADLMVTHRLSAALATEAASTALAACEKMGFAVTVAVVDSDAVLQALVRGDGAGIHTVQAAQDKAFTAVTYRRATSAVAERQLPRGPFAVIVKEPRMLADEGGLPIVAGDETIGAIGVSGSTGKDEDCGNAAIDMIRARAK